MSNDIREGLIYYFILVASLSVHEWAHAISADKLGDDTPRNQGRLTLNPISHIDPIGTVFIPLFMLFMPGGFSLIGWGKPVQVDMRNFKQKVRDDIIVSMAGPFSNLMICLGIAIVGGVIVRFVPQAAPLIGKVIVVNALLIVFNMIPIPPLDGSHVMRHIVKMNDETYAQFSSYGFIILIVLINLPFFWKFAFMPIYFILFTFSALSAIISGVNISQFLPM